MYLHTLKNHKTTLYMLPTSAARMSSSSVTADATTSSSLTFFEDEYVEASLSTRPSTPGDTIVRIKIPTLSCLGYLQKNQYIQTLISAKQVATIVKTATGVRRVSLVWDGASEIRLIPLHGIDAEWKPMMDPQLEYHTSYPGYVTSRSGPKHSNETLEKFQADVTNGNQPVMDLTCYSTPETSQNLFAKIIRGELEQWRVWESESHVAFLTPFGNSPGKTVLVPRKHVDSDILSTPIEDFEDLAGATWDVVTVLMRTHLRGNGDQLGTCEADPDLWRCRKYKRATVCGKIYWSCIFTTWASHCNRKTGRNAKEVPLCIEPLIIPPTSE
jgi:diadenosine tetraphosphate (Ap4A) HIT family hydrolase